MKRFLTLALVLLTISTLMAQQYETDVLFLDNGPINIGLNEVKKDFTPPASKLLKSGNTSTCTINVTYIGFPENAKAAFEYAISIWESNLSSTVPVNVIAKWENLPGNTLASCNPTAFFKNFNEARIKDVYYPVALVEKLSGEEKNSAEDADIACNFNNSASWYFGIDGNTPSSKYDFVTTVLHELGHGLGISGFLTSKNGIGDISTTSKNPSIFDYYITNKNNQRILDKSIFSYPSTTLHNQLTSSNLNISKNNNSGPQLYAPTNWRDGVSIYHLKSNQSDSNELMNAFLYKGLAIHDLGENTMNTLSAIGWNDVTFLFQKLKDVEETTGNLFVQTKANNNSAIENTSVEVIYSTDNFATNKTATFTYNANTGLLESYLSIDNFKGRVKYYFKANTTSNETLTYPSLAPDKVFSFKIGPDYYSPILNHDPIELISSEESAMNFNAVASDNIGIDAVIVEYMINGVEQEPFQLNKDYADNYTGSLILPVQVFANDKIEYKITAYDSAARKNRKTLPAQGYFIAKVEEQNKSANVYTSNNDIAEVKTTIGMYPNPCINNLFIDCNNIDNSSSVEISITDLYGKTVYRQTHYDVQFNPKVRIDLSNINSGIYLASVTDSNSNSFTQKILKN